MKNREIEMENYQNQKTSKFGLVGKVVFSVLGIVGLASIVGCAPQGLVLETDPNTQEC